MITKVLPLQFLKKSPFYGSCDKMRYRISKNDDRLTVCIYPGPFCFDATPENKKKFYDFTFSDEGYDEALALLNEVYESTDWDKEQVPF